MGRIPFWISLGSHPSPNTYWDLYSPHVLPIRIFEQPILPLSWLSYRREPTWFWLHHPRMSQGIVRCMFGMSKEMPFLWCSLHQILTEGLGGLEGFEFWVWRSFGVSECGEMGNKKVKFVLCVSIPSLYLSKGLLQGSILHGEQWVLSRRPNFGINWGWIFSQEIHSRARVSAGAGAMEDTYCVFVSVEIGPQVEILFWC